jgi:hypothetical protein
VRGETGCEQRLQLVLTRDDELATRTESAGLAEQQHTVVLNADEQREHLVQRIFLCGLSANE